MSKDPYETLGVPKNASAQDIRKAWRKLARDLHPDLRPGDSEAEARFKDISAAYQLLKDPEQRARYDRGEIDASGQERPQHDFYRQYADSEDGGRYASSAGFEDFEDISDLFSGLFGARGGPRAGGRAGAGGLKARGPDQRYHLEVGFLEAANGAKKRITLPGGDTLDLTVPPGTGDGSVLRLKGKGGPGLGGGPPGDALVSISVAPHPFFRREGDDIVMDLPITLGEAVLGGKVEVPTLSGRVAMTVPKGSDTGDVLRLRGKGVKRGDEPPGDQRVILKLVLPDTIDPELEEFIGKWRERHPYEPRASLRSAT